MPARAERVRSRWPGPGAVPAEPRWGRAGPCPSGCGDTKPLGRAVGAAGDLAGPSRGGDSSGAGRPELSETGLAAAGARQVLQTGDVGNTSLSRIPVSALKVTVVAPGLMAAPLV